MLSNVCLGGRTTYSKAHFGAEINAHRWTGLLISRGPTVKKSRSDLTASSHLNSSAIYS
jgi:hypothetical protein